MFGSSRADALVKLFFQPRHLQRFGERQPPAGFPPHLHQQSCWRIAPAPSLEGIGACEVVRAVLMLKLIMSQPNLRIFFLG